MNLLLDKQFRRSIPKEKEEACLGRVYELVKALELGQEAAFWSKYDGKPMGGAKHVYKFRANKADRIIYVRTNDIPHMKARFPNSIVLLRYTDHDSQGTIAARIDLGSLSGDGIQQAQAYQTDFQFTEQTTEDEVNRYFSTMVSNIICPEQLREYLNSTEDNYDVFLSDEQYQIIERRSLPLVLYGCAGSGKTILSVHLLSLLLASGGKGLYTSVSPKLNKKAETLFHNIESRTPIRHAANECVNFKSLSEWLQGHLKRKPNFLVEYSDFEAIFCDENEYAGKLRDLRALGITPLDAWAEIRGILKGHLSEEWEWNNPIPNSFLADDEIQFFQKNGLIESIDASFKQYRKRNPNVMLLKEVSDLLEHGTVRSESKCQQLRDAAQRIDNHFATFDKGKRMLSWEEYLELDEEYSIYPADTRKRLYELCECYDAWLQKKDYYDDNDLARDYCASQCGPALDYIVVDEVQDLTEMQLYALFSMCRNKERMIFSGDIHQVINPTYFSEDRLKKLYYLKCGRKLTIEVLKKNYRSQNKIVAFANRLSRLRKQRIGSRSYLSEISEESNIEGWRPMLLAPTENNLKSMINRINTLAYAAVIVPDEETYEKLIALLDDKDNGQIYTIQEIKGLEKKYVLCYDLASTHKEAWGNIFSEADIKKNIKYRYYFNSLYVGVTRAQEFLCFFEHDVPSKMGTWMEQFTEKIERFDIGKLFLCDVENSGELWYQQAIQDEENLDYRRARLKYNRSQYRDYEFCLLRCDVKELLQQKRDRDALIFAFNNFDGKNYGLFDVIATGTKAEAISHLCKVIVGISQNIPPKSYELLLDAVHGYDGGDKVAEEIMNKVVENTCIILETIPDIIKGGVAK